MIKNQQANKWIVVILVLAAVLPVLMKHRLNVFFTPNLEETPIEENQALADCIKQHIPDHAVLPFWLLQDGELVKADKETYYTYEYLFAPVILTRNEIEYSNQFIVLLSSGTIEEADELFEDYRFISCSDELFLFTAGD